MGMISLQSFFPVMHFVKYIYIYISGRENSSSAVLSPSEEAKDGVFFSHGQLHLGKS